MSTRFCTDTWAWRMLVGVAGVQSVLYGVIAWLSRDFVYGHGFRQRPIIAVLVLFAACFVLYAASTALALRCRPGVRLASTIVIASFAFRAVLLFSEPIQEIDIYRYLWDGAVTSHGVNPIRYAPATVLRADDPGNYGAKPLPDDFQRLIRLRDESPSLAEVLARVHYSDLPTIYPPVSQVVFALGDRLTPPAASLSTRVTILKAVLLAFDMVTIGLIWLLVNMAGRHVGWVIAYAWCPLVLKEFANSGHLDTIAVCLSTASVWCLAKACQSAGRLPWRWILPAAAILGLSVGAKLYPIVLLPLFAAWIARKHGGRCAMVFTLIALFASAGSLAPMLFAKSAGPAMADIYAAETPPMPPNVPPSSVDEQDQSQPSQPLAGLAAFLGRWEMNDFLFLIVVENFRLSGENPELPEAWFAVVPDDTRARMITPVAHALSIDQTRAAFVLARAITTIVFGCVAIWQIARVWRRNTLSSFLEAAFLTLAWFWLLSPTQNPWYWTWALPLLPFARGRAWFALSGLAFAYYLRFWLLYHRPDTPVLGTPYTGAAFFDFVVTWVEYVPWFAILALIWFKRRRDTSADGGAGDAAFVANFTEQSPTFK